MTPTPPPAQPLTDEALDDNRTDEQFMLDTICDGDPVGLVTIPRAIVRDLRQRVRELEEFAERADASDAAWRILCGGKQKIIEQLEAERDALLDSVEYWWKMTEIERNDLRAWKAKVETLRPPHSIANAVATRVVLSVSEIPDRNSPDDFPEAMLVTADELRAIVMNALNATRDSESVS